MKKLFLSLLISGLISSVAFAQDVKQGKPDKAEWDKKIKTELNLTQEQIVKYDELSKEYGEKMDGLTKDAGLTKEAQKEKKMALKKEKEAKLFEFITPEQQTKYRELIEKKKAAKPGGTQ
jgi:hypothetical protein